MRTNARGLTMIEVMVVMLVLAIFMAIAVAGFFAAARHSEAANCRSSMHAVANAEREYRIRASNHAYMAVSSAADLATLAAAAHTTSPVCPSGGAYTVILSGTTSDGRSVPAGKFAVECSITGHSSFVEGVDVP